MKWIGFPSHIPSTMHTISMLTKLYYVFATFSYIMQEGVFLGGVKLCCAKVERLSHSGCVFLHQVKGRYFQKEFLAEKTLKQLYILLSPFNRVIICDPDWGAVYLWGLIKQIGQSWWMMHLTDQNIQREYLAKHADRSCFASFLISQHLEHLHDSILMQSNCILVIYDI